MIFFNIEIFLFWLFSNPLQSHHLFLICFSEENVRPVGHKFEEHKEVDRENVKYAPRKRSRAASSSRAAKAAPRPIRRTRARRGNQQAKIGDDVESEESVPDKCQGDQNMDTDYISNEIGKGNSNKEQ